MNQAGITKIYNKWYEAHEWTAYDAAMMCEKAIELYHIETGKCPSSLMDVGCGSGKYSFTFSQLLPETSILGVDISSVGISKAAARYKGENLRYLCRDGVLPISPHDLIFVKGCSLFNKKAFPDAESKGFLRSIARNCKPGGVVLIIGRTDFSGSVYPGSGWYCRSQSEIDALFINDCDPEYASARMVDIKGVRGSGLVDYAIVLRRPA